jgi:hypothetical protein
MNIQSDLESIGSNTFSEFSNPFRKDAVVAIHMHMYTGCFGFTFENPSYSATVETKVNNTKGVQEFTGDSFYDLSVKIQRYINQLQ